MRTVFKTLLIVPFLAFLLANQLGAKGHGGYEQAASVSAYEHSADNHDGDDLAAYATSHGFFPPRLVLGASLHTHQRPVRTAFASDLKATGPPSATS